MNLTQYSKTAFSALTVADVKAHIPVYGTTHDAYLAKLLTRVVDRCEADTGRDFSSTTWDFSDAPPKHFPVTGWPFYYPYSYYWYPTHCRLRLPRSPVQTVVSATYYDAANAPQTLDYSLAGDWLTYPHITTYDRLDAIQVRFTSGYPTLPPKAEQLILFLCASWFANRDGEDMPETAQRLVDLLSRGDWQ